MTDKLNSSPDRGSFRKECRIKQLIEEGKDASTDDFFDSLLRWDQQKLEKEQDPAWQKHNLEYDLRSTELIIEKVKSSDNYAQNLYAALCNNQFIQLENTWDILKEKYWSCSWRYAGGIIADIREEGDYIDWYCSGIRGDGTVHSDYVSEGHIATNIKQDLKKIGWVVIPNNDDDFL